MFELRGEPGGILSATLEICDILNIWFERGIIFQRTYCNKFDDKCDFFQNIVLANETEFNFQFSLLIRIIVLLTYLKSLLYPLRLY